MSADTWASINRGFEFDVQTLKDEILRHVWLYASQEVGLEQTAIFERNPYAFENYIRMQVFRRLMRDSYVQRAYASDTSQFWSTIA
jgi:hypothetical protein